MTTARTMGIWLPHAELTLRIAATPESVRDTIDRNTADHVMTGPQPDTVFRGRVQGKHFELFNELPQSAPILSPIHVTLDGENGSTRLGASIGPANNMRFFIVIMPVLILIAAVEFSSGLAGLLSLLHVAFAKLIWFGVPLGISALVYFEYFLRKALEAEIGKAETKFRELFSGQLSA